jgi:hypothetical protein
MQGRVDRHVFQGVSFQHEQLEPPVGQVPRRFVERQAETDETQHESHDGDGQRADLDPARRASRPRNGHHQTTTA